MSDSSVTVIDRIGLSVAASSAARYKTRGGATRAALAWLNDGLNPATVTTFSVNPKLFYYPSDVLNDGATFYFRLTEALAATQVANAFNGALFPLTNGLQAPVPADGFFNASEKSLKTNSSINTGNNIIISNRLTWSVEFWLFVVGYSAVQQDIYTEGAGFHIFLNVGGNLCMAGPGGTTFTTTGVPVTAGVWHHVVFMNASGTGSAYIDGSLNVSTAWTQGLSASLLGSTIQGQSQFYVASPAFYTSVNITPDRIKQHYQDMTSGATFIQIETNSIASGASLARTYGIGGTAELPETLFMQYVRGSGDSHVSFSGTYYKE